VAEADEEQPVARNYWIVRCYGGTYHVRAPAAAALERTLRRRWLTRWVEFIDVSGSRIHIRAVEVRGLIECTAHQRATDRRHARCLENEEKANDQPWEE
jgi:hypothetical protein